MPWTLPLAMKNRFRSIFEHRAFWRTMPTLLLLMVTQPVLPAQTVQPQQAPRDPQAVAVITGALNALGGQVAFTAIKDVVSTGSCSSLQSTDGPTTSPEAQTFTWTIAGSQFKYETISRGNQYIFASGHGNPMRSFNGTSLAAVRESARSTKAYHLPGLILSNESRDSLFGFRYIGTKQLSSASAIAVEITPYYGNTPDRGNAQTWYFDPTSYMPMAVEYRLPGENVPSVAALVTMTFGSYQTQGAARFPMQIVTQYPSFTSQCTFNSIRFNVSPPASTFDLSAGGQN